MECALIQGSKQMLPWRWTSLHDDGVVNNMQQPGLLTR